MDAVVRGQGGEPGGADHGDSEMAAGGGEGTGRGARSPSPGAGRAPPRVIEPPASPAAARRAGAPGGIPGGPPGIAAAAAAAAAAPVPPDTPPPQGGQDEVRALRERLDYMAGRIVGLEASVQALQSGAQSALNDLVTQARTEFESQRASGLTLRFDIQEEASTLRRYLEETRRGVETVYADASGGFTNLQNEVRGQGQELRRLVGLAAAAGHGASPASAPGASDPLQAAGSDPWQQGAASSPQPGTNPAGGGSGGDGASGGGWGNWGRGGGGGGGGGGAPFGGFSGPGGDRPRPFSINPAAWGAHKVLEVHANGGAYRVWRERALDHLSRDRNGCSRQDVCALLKWAE